MANGSHPCLGLRPSCTTVFFGSSDLGLEAAQAGTYTLVPTAAMREALAKDYAAMTGMIFGEVPSLEEVLASVEMLGNLVNNPSHGLTSTR